MAASTDPKAASNKEQATDVLDRLQKRAPCRMRT